MAPSWLVPLHGAFAFTTLTCVFSEDYEIPAVAVHAVGAACCLGLLWKAVTVAHMPALPLQLAACGAVAAAAVNARHFAARSREGQPAARAARRLRQWLQCLGCIGCGLLFQAGLGSPAAATLAAACTAAVTWAVEHEGGAWLGAKAAAAQRLWGNWPALSATLLLMLDAATPLADPAALAASTTLLPIICTIAANALLIPRALAIPNTMFLTATGFGTAASWAALGCIAVFGSRSSIAGSPAAEFLGVTGERLAFAATTAALWLYTSVVRQLHADFCAEHPASMAETDGAQ